LVTKAELKFGCRTPEDVYRTTDKSTGLSASGVIPTPVFTDIPDTGHKRKPFVVLKYKPDIELDYASGHQLEPDTGHAGDSCTGHQKVPDISNGPDIKYVKTVSVVKRIKGEGVAKSIEPPPLSFKVHPSQSRTEQVVNLLGVESGC
jgi:hypothetical protein